MTKLEFMKELESLLSDIPLEEREEALQYYNGYFEDAGEDHEEEIIKELGSPKKIASLIKADLNSNADDLENRGYYTEKGYQDTAYDDEKFELVGPDSKKADNQQDDHSNNSNYSYGTNQGNSTNSANGTGNANYNNQSNGASQAGGAGQANGANSAYHTYNTNYGSNYNRQNNYQGAGKAGYQNTQNNNKSNNTALIVIIAILSFPIWFPVAMTAFGIVIAILATIFGLIVGFGAAGVAMIVGGIALFIAGLIQLSVPFVGILFCGCGLLVLGLGMLFTLACVMLCKHAVPALIRGIVNLCRLPFKNRSVMA